MNMVSFAAIFTILTLLAAFRLEVGNDYGNYVTTCHEIFNKGYVVTEPGFNLVVRILYTISGKEDYILMFAFFGAAIVFLFLYAFITMSDSFLWSVFLFMTLGVYFRSFNTVRYYFVLAITLLLLRLVSDVVVQDPKDGSRHISYQRLIFFIILTLVSATFHKSVLVIIPLYLFCRLPLRKWMLLLIGVLAAAGFFLYEPIMELGLKFYPSYIGTEYITRQVSISDYLPAVGRGILVLILSIICYREAVSDRADNKLYMNMNILGIALYCSCYRLPLISRIGYYLMTSHLIFVPNIISSLTGRKKKIVMIAVAVFALIYYVYFLRGAYEVGTRVLPYRSWLFDTADWLDQTDIFDWGVLTPLER